MSLFSCPSVSAFSGGVAPRIKLEHPPARLFMYHQQSMRKKIWVPILVTAAFIALGLQSCQVATPSVAPAYSVDKYDPARNAAADFDQTISQAKQSGKRILLEVGGNWCSWCRALDRFIHDNPAVATALRDHYIIMKVNMSEENRNQEFLGRFPEIKGYPHIFVLDADGNVLHSQDTGALEERKSYSEKAFLDFLNRWVVTT
ncbi:MAG: thioredoxin family protein [Acidobacteria bacterium]|nr:MAG: thioredoxin family protein [Acidobacteriota bacterium]